MRVPQSSPLGATEPRLASSWTPQRVRAEPQGAAEERGAALVAGMAVSTPKLPNDEEEAPCPALHLAAAASRKRFARFLTAAYGKQRTPSAPAERDPRYA